MCKFSMNENLIHLLMQNFHASECNDAKDDVSELCR